MRGSDRCGRAATGAAEVPYTADGHREAEEGGDGGEPAPRGVVKLYWKPRAGGRSQNQRVRKTAPTRREVRVVRQVAWGMRVP